MAYKADADTLGLMFSVIRIYETGMPVGDYGKVSVRADGPGGVRQISYGVCQFAQYWTLGTVLQSYLDQQGTYSKELKPYAKLFNDYYKTKKLTSGFTSLPNDMFFRNFLSMAGQQDPVMRKVQDDIYKRLFFDPAYHFFLAEGFTYPLSLLVLFDTFVHTGPNSMPLIRLKFKEPTPAFGGEEKKWIKGFIEAKRDYLLNIPKLVKTVYRMDTFANAVANNNWELKKTLEVKEFSLSMKKSTP